MAQGGSNPDEIWHRFSWAPVTRTLAFGWIPSEPAMSDDDELEPRLRRMRASGKGQGRKFLHRVLAAANLAQAGSATGGRSNRFDGSRIGRGAGVGCVLASRDVYGAFRQRRVIAKSRIVKLAGKGRAAARAHLRYIERDGTTRDCGRGQLYGAEADQVDGMAFLDRQTGDRHQFRFIVSAEDGAEYDDLKPLTRRLMERVEQDLGTRLDWVAVDHFNTGHPHSRIIVRGKDDRDKDLIIAREYMTEGMRERAAELVDLDLGPRSTDAIRARLRTEVEQERLTSIDRALLREADADVLVSTAGRDAFDQAVRMGRLRKLERMGLAERVGGAHWRLAPDTAETLRRMGERGDIIRTMQRAFAARGQVRALTNQAIYDPAVEGVRPIVGRIVERACPTSSTIATICWSMRLTVAPIMSRSERANISRCIPPARSCASSLWHSACAILIASSPRSLRPMTATTMSICTCDTTLLRPRRLPRRMFVTWKRSAD